MKKIQISNWGTPVVFTIKGLYISSKKNKKTKKPRDELTKRTQTTVIVGN